MVMVARLVSSDLPGEWLVCVLVFICTYPRPWGWMWAYSIVRRWRNWPVRSMSWWPRWVSDVTAHPRTTTLLCICFFSSGHAFQVCVTLCKSVLDGSNSRCLCVSVCVCVLWLPVATSWFGPPNCLESGVLMYRCKQGQMLCNLIQGYRFSRTRNFILNHTHIPSLVPMPVPNGSHSSFEAGYILDGKEIWLPTIYP